MRSALGIDNKTSKHAVVIYVRAEEEKIQMRRSIEEVATAALYLAAKFAELPICPEDMDRVSRADKTSVMRAARAIQQELDLEIDPVCPTTYVSQYASALGVGMEAQSKAKEWIEDSKADLAGCAPTNVAAAAVYAASLTDPDCNITHEEVVTETAVSPARLTNLYRELYQD
jgi:transcription initiation factor TFIIIB Brf1 subunit/transcription initiation factor TFIIB